MAKNSCVDCTTPESIPKTEILYSQGSTSGSALRTHYRLPEPVSGYALYHCDDKYKTGFYLVLPQAANNLVTNPTFFNDLDGWSTFNAQSSRTNAIAFDSGFSVRINGSGDTVTAERREYLEMEIDSFLPGYPYTFSGYMWGPLLWDISDPLMYTISIADDLGNEVFSDQLDKMNIWKRLSVTLTTDQAATSLFLRVNLRSQDQRENQPPHNLTGEYNLTNEYLFFDMAQLEYGVEATTPFHGSTNTCASCDTACGGYSWEGIAHNSASTRDECVHDGGKLICLSDLGFEVTSHTGHSAPPIRDISFPLNNRPGEFHQKSVADARILTLTGQLCETTLKDLECSIHNLGKSIFPNLSPCSCCGKFLLVYHHESCENDGCDPERDLAICVTYMGGLEGARTNHYSQVASLQFKAHEPFWFEFPGHSSAPLSFVKVVQTPGVLQISSDGTARGFPISSGNTYNTVGCRPGTNSVVIGGDFTSIDGDPDRCEENLAIYDCNEWVDLCYGFVGGPIHQITTDAQGNILVAGSFSGPCNNVAIIYEDDTIGCFGYTGGVAYSIASASWAQVIVGTDDGVYILDNDGNWTLYPTDGRVEGLTVDAAGNVYAVGQFTTINGIETGGAAIFNVNAEECIDPSTGVWEGLGFTFNGAVNSIDIDPDTGTVYVGGEFTQATPYPVDVCNTSNGTRIDSSGSNQILTFQNFGGTSYVLRVDYLNIITRNLAQDCLDNGDYLRITGQSSLGTNYNFLLGPHNASVQNVGTNGTLYWIAINIDTGIDLGDPCLSLNQPLIDELDQTRTDIETYTPLTLPGGAGIDNTLSQLSAQCITVSEQFQGDTIDVNYVAQLSGNTLSPMGSGVSNPVNVIAVHPLTKEVYAGTNDGLKIWNGLAWFNFPGSVGTDSVVSDVKFCDNGCSTLILHDGNTAVVAGTSEVYYNGDVQPSSLNLIVHGPARIESFVHNGSNNKMNLCTQLHCNEVADLDFVSGEYDSNFRNNLNPSVLGGSRYDICLNSCGINDISLYMSEDDAQTKATLVWRESYMGIEALCCSKSISSLQISGAGGSALQQAQVCAENYDYLAYHRAPTDDDCSEQGVTEGTLWHNAADQCGLWIAKGGCGCEDEEALAGAYVGSDGTAITDVDGELYCGEEDVDCDTFT